MATAYLLKNGLIAQEDEWSNVRLDVNSGFVASFVKNEVKYIHLNYRTIKEGDEDYISAGYYPESDVLEYITLERGAILIQNNHKYSDFKPAKDGEDVIIVRKLITKEDPNNVGEWKAYTRVSSFTYDSAFKYFKHTPTFIYTDSIIPPGATVQDNLLPLDSTGNSFLSNNIGFINTNPNLTDEQKEEMSRELAKTAIIITNIIIDVFSYFDETEYQSLIASQKSYWGSSIFNNQVTPEDIKLFQKNIYAFYQVARRFTNKYKDLIEGNEKLSYIVLVLDYEALSLLTLESRKQAVIEITKNQLKVYSESIEWERAIIKLINSFAIDISNNNLQDVEDFLSWLTEVNQNTGNVNSDNSGQTYYEILYDRMSTDFNITKSLIELNNLVFDSNAQPDNTRDEFVQSLYNIWSYTKYNIIDETTYDLKPNSISYDDLGQTNIDFTNTLTPAEKDMAVWHYSVVPGYIATPASDNNSCTIANNCYEEVFYKNATYADDAAPKTLNYKATKSFGFYGDNFDFNIKGNKIQVLTSLPTDFYIGDDQYDNRVVYGDLIYGNYHLLQPVTLLNLDIEATTPLPFTKYSGVTEQDVNTEIPVFVLHHLASGNSRYNIENAIGLTIDAILTFSGIGNLTKLRTLKWFGGSGALSWMEVTSISIGALEFTSGVLAFFSNITDCDPGDEFCKNLKIYINTIAIASGGLDVAANLLRKRAARRLVIEAGGSDATTAKNNLKTELANRNPTATPSELDATADLMILDSGNIFNLTEALNTFTNKFPELTTAQINELQNLLQGDTLIKFLSDFFDSSHTDIQTLFANLSLYTARWEVLQDITELSNNLKVLDHLIDHTDANLMADVLSELNHTDRGTEMRGLIRESPEDLENIVIRVLKNPENAKTFSRDIDNPRWKRWSESRFFKYHTQQGKFFEKNVMDEALVSRTGIYTTIKNKISATFSKDLDQYDFYTQIQVFYNDTDYFVIDQLFVKREFNITKEEWDIADIFILDSKKQLTTNLTKNQKAAIKAASQPGFTGFKIRSLSGEVKYKATTTNKNLELNQETIPLKFSNNNVTFSTAYDGPDGTVFTGMQKVEYNSANDNFDYTNM